MKRRRSIMLGVWVVFFVGMWMTGACGAPVGPGGTPPAAAAECPASIDVPCMRYRIELDGNPSTDPVMRAKYIAAFGSACYMSEAKTFDCFYQKWEKACEDAARIGAVSSNMPYDPGYKCQPVGNGDYTLQIGPDTGNITRITLEKAPRQTPLVDVNGVETEVSGPYRNLVEMTTIEPGKDFNDSSGMVDGDGGLLKQNQWVLAVNRKNNGGKIRSDLAGFQFPCAKGSPEICTEPDFLEDPFDPVGTKPNVHHVVPMKDKRCCPWGTNAYKNAAVISAKLNGYFGHDNPPEEEVKRLNNASAYAP